MEIHLVDCGIEPEILAKLKGRWEESSGVESLRIHAFDAPSLERHMVNGITPAALARLKAGELIPGTQPVLYLDSDAMAFEVPRELFGMDLEGAPMGGVRDRGIPILGRSGYALDKLPFELDPSAPYVNSGVLVIQPEAFRAEDVWGRALNLLESHRGDFHHNDQAILNILFNGRTKLLPKVWNQQRPLYDEFPLLVRSRGILHFLDKVKPWHFRARRGCGAVSTWHGIHSGVASVLPPLPAPIRSFRGNLGVLWLRKAQDLAKRRLQRAI